MFSDSPSTHLHCQWYYICLFVCFLVFAFPCCRLCRSSFLIHQSKLFYLTWFHLGRTITDMLTSFYMLKSYMIIDCNIYSGSLLLFVLVCSDLFSKIDTTACLFPVWYLSKSPQLKQNNSSSTSAMNAPNIHQVQTVWKHLPLVKA